MMLRSRFVLRCLALFAVLLLVTSTHQGSAEDGGVRFIQVEEGLMDTETGLVWGFNLTDVGDFITFDPETGFGNGSLYSWNFAQDMWLPCDDGAWICTYEDWSNWYFEREDTDWRLPTKDEMVAAAQAGIGDHLDESPFDGFQGVCDCSNWSSTTGKVKGPEKEGAWMVNLITGEATLVSKSSAIGVIVVRGGSAPEPPSKPGKGGGRNR